MKKAADAEYKIEKTSTKRDFTGYGTKRGLDSDDLPNPFISRVWDNILSLWCHYLPERVGRVALSILVRVPASTGIVTMVRRVSDSVSRTRWCVTCV
jgi:hypothetical protein